MLERKGTEACWSARGGGSGVVYVGSTNKNLTVEDCLIKLFCIKNDFYAYLFKQTHIRRKWRVKD